MSSRWYVHSGHTAAPGSSGRRKKDGKTDIYLLIFGAKHGASRLRALRMVVLPLAAPGLAATAIFVILLAWNDFFYALILTSGNARTVTPYIGGFITDKAVLWGRLYASSALIMVPVLVFGLAVQKQLAHGLTGGAVKG